VGVITAWCNYSGHMQSQTCLFPASQSTTKMTLNLLSACVNLGYEVDVVFGKAYRPIFTVNYTQNDRLSIRDANARIAVSHVVIVDDDVSLYFALRIFSNS
jgi:hypothetical protein